MSNFAIMTLLLLCFPAKSDVMFNYEKGNTLPLGRSIDIRYPMDSKKNCLVDTESAWIESIPENAGGATLVSVEGKYTDDYRELARELYINGHLRASMAAKNAEASGSAGLTYNTISKYADLMFIFQAQYEFGSNRLKNPVLQEKYQALINDKKYSDFVAQCGTHFSISEERWAYASIVININRIDESVKKRLTADYSSRSSVAEVGSLSNKIDTSLQYSALKKLGRAALTFYANGGDPANASELALATQSDDIEKSLVAMKKYMSGVKRDTSVPSRYKLVSFGLFGLEIKDDPQRLLFLENAYYAGSRYQVRIEEMNKRTQNAITSFGEESGLVKSFQSDTLKLQTRKASIDMLVLGCVRDDKCDTKLLENSDPNLQVNLSILRNVRLRSTCVFAGKEFAGIDLAASGDIIDPQIIQDVSVWRSMGLLVKDLSQIDVKVGSIDKNNNRLTINIPNIDTDLLRANGSNTTLRAQLNKARQLRYQIDVTTIDGEHQWFDLGKVSIREESCRQ